jgi:hypothetical protein
MSWDEIVVASGLLLVFLSNTIDKIYNEQQQERDRNTQDSNPTHY